MTLAWFGAETMIYGQELYIRVNSRVDSSSHGVTCHTTPCVTFVNLLRSVQIGEAGLEAHPVPISFLIFW